MTTIREAVAELTKAPEGEEEFTDETEVESADDPIEDVELDEEISEEEILPDPAIDPPAGWSEEEKEAFLELTPTLQETLVRRERERDGLMTQKSQELSQQKKETEERDKLLKDKEERYESVLQRQAQNAPALPDPELLDESSEKYDPDQYHKSRAKYDTALAKQQEAQGELSKLNDEHNAEFQSQIREWQAEQTPIYEKHLPEILVNDGDNDLVKSIFSYAGSLGLEPKAVRAASASEIIVLNKARLWDKSLSKEPTKARKASPSLRPGSPKPAGSVSKKVEQLKAKAKKSGNIKDAMAALKAGQTRG